MTATPNRNPKRCNVAARHAPLIAIYLPLVAWAAIYLGQDPWWDEIASLNEFTLTGFLTTVSHYAGSHGNHHTFFNLLNNFYTRAIGIRDLYAAIDAIHWLRLLQLLFALGTATLAYFSARRFLSPAAGFIAGLVLVTTIPFLNFALQLRGYSLSMLLTVALLFCFWDYRRTRRPSRALLVAGLTCLLLYTMPGNAYFVLALMLLAAARLLARLAARRRAAPRSMDPPARRARLRQPDLILLGALFLGSLLFLAAYSPLLGPFLESRFATAHPPRRTYALTTLLPQLLHALVSFRYLLLLLFAIGILQWIRHRTIPGESEPTTHLGELAVLLLLPFVISFIQDSWPPDRTFVFLAPIGSLLLGGAIAILPATIRGVWRYRRACALALFAYCAGSLAYAYGHIQNQLTENLSRSVRAQNVVYNYYLSREFDPSRDLQALVSAAGVDPAPIVLCDEVDRVAFGAQLRRHRLDHYAIVRTWEEEEDDMRIYSGILVQSQNGADPATRMIIQSYRRSLPPKCRPFVMLHRHLVQEGLVSPTNPHFYLLTSFPPTVKHLTDCRTGIEFTPLQDDVSYTNAFRVAASRP